MSVWVVRKAEASNKAAQRNTSAPLKEAFLNPSFSPYTPANPAALHPFIDKLTLTLALPAPLQEGLNSGVKGLKAKGVLKGGAKPLKLYAYVQLIALPGTDERVRLDFSPKQPGVPAVRLDFNPCNLAPEHLIYLHVVLSELWPGGWTRVIEEARVSRVDVAVDLPGAEMHHFHLLPERTVTPQDVWYGVKLKTLYIGKRTGKQLAIYDKAHEQWQRAQKASPGKEVQKGQPVVRIEKRVKNTGLPLQKLSSLKCPLSSFWLVNLPANPPPSKTGKWAAEWAKFVKSVTDPDKPTPLAKAVTKVKPGRKKAIFRKHLKAHAVDWWDPHAIWTSWPDALVLLLAGTEKPSAE